MGKWRALLRRGRLDEAMDEEMRFHIDMEDERLVQEQGLDRQEARRRAHVAFGGVEKYKEEGRDTRPLQWLDAMSLDARLGIRMLVKHRDRKSTRLNSSHSQISYAVFCLKKKK